MVDPDLVLVEAIGRRDHGAFESLVKRYQGPLLSFITRYIGDRRMAEDLTQEVFLRIYRAAPQFQAKTKVSTWIFRIAYNQALTEIGRRRRHQDLREALCRRSEGDAERPPSEPAARHELEEEIVPALGRLPDNQRAALLLRVNEELSYREIGDILGVSVQSVESLLFRARTSLKRYFDKT
jgi:RNA polymerase sigma-70 factor (ECF subfamily)